VTRGLAVRHNTVAVIATLSAVLGIDCATMRIHREDPLTTHACPGKNVRKTAVIAEVRELLMAGGRALRQGTVRVGPRAGGGPRHTVAARRIDTAWRHSDGHFR